VELIEMAEIRDLPLRTRAVVASTVSYITGHRPEYGAMGRIASECGARLYVDATQSAGALAIDLERIGPDMCAINPYKYCSRQMARRFSTRVPVCESASSRRFSAGEATGTGVLSRT
jgi:hypothetical protein